MTRARMILAARCLLVSVFVVGTVVGVLFGSSPGRQQLFVISIGAYAAVGWLVTRTRPANAIGWLFLIVAALTGVRAASDGAMQHALAIQQAEVWYGSWGAWVAVWVWFPLFVSATLFTLLLFPDGLPSRRWRPVLWVSLAASVLLTVGSSLQAQLAVGGQQDPTHDSCPSGTTLVYGSCAHWVSNPLGLSDAVGSVASGALFTVPAITLAGCLVLAVVSVVRRFRASRGATRLQMRWFAFGAVLLLGWLVVNVIAVPAGLDLVSDAGPLGAVVWPLALAALPTTAGIAILRYRLYEIDRIISRTTSYAIVTGTLLATYALVVTAATRLLPSPGKLPVAAATLTAAVIARPLYQRVQHAVDRRFNRARYDAERTVDDFGTRLRHEVDTTVVSDDLVQVVHTTLQPEGVQLWLSR